MKGMFGKGNSYMWFTIKNGLTIYTHSLDIEESKKGNSSHKAG